MLSDFEPHVISRLDLLALLRDVSLQSELSVLERSKIMEVAWQAPVITNATHPAVANGIGCPAEQAGIWPGGSNEANLFVANFDRVIKDRYGRTHVLLVVR